MTFDPTYFGPQGVTDEDRAYAGSRYAEVRAAARANRYYDTWGEAGDPPLPIFAVTLGRCARGLLPGGGPWRFQQASRRATRSQADLRWGPDGRGYRRLLHPNGVCLFGRWEIDEAPDGTGYTGYFAAGSRGLVVGRYSACCTETHAGRTRSLSLVGKIYPTEDPEHAEPLRTANFIAQEDLGGTCTTHVNDVEIRTAPDTTPWRRGRDTPLLLLTVIAFLRSDRRPALRQVYPIAELGKPDHEATIAPKYMRLGMSETQPRRGEPGVDFRDEILSHIYDAGDPQPRRELVFDVEVSDRGTLGGLLVKRLHGPEWKRIGRIVFDEAVASYNGDHVIHFAHPAWRADRNDPRSRTGPRWRGRGGGR